MAPDTWQVMSLADICDEKISYGIVQAGPHVEDGVPYIKSSDLNSELKLEDLQRTAVEIHKKYIRSTVRPGDIVFSLRGNIGLCRIVPGSIYEANLTQGTARISIKPEHSTEFFLQQITGPELNKSIQAKAKGSTFQEISLGALREVPVLVPPKAEQTKIAQILSAWDKAIATTERLLANSQQQKNMLTHHLLNGQKRFSEFVTSQSYQRTSHGSIPSDWGYVSIAEIANQQSKVNSAQSNLPVLSCSKYDGLVDSLKYFKKKVYSDDTSKYRVVELGDFAYPSNHIEEGSIGYQNLYPAGIVSPIYTVFRTNDAVDDYFLYRTLKTDKYRQIFSAATSASVDRRGSLRWKEFSKIQVPLPSLPEQQKIAQVLSTADAEIANLQAQLDKLKLEKKALMQQLLTGKRRVRLDDEEEDMAPIRRVG